MNQLLPLPAAIGAVAGLEEVLAPEPANIAAALVVFTVAWLAVAAVLRRGASAHDEAETGTG